MPKHYQYKIDSGIDTFSQFEAGVNFKFESTTISSDTKFEKGDLILGVKLPSSIYVLLVDDFNSNEISLTKLIEVDSDFQVNFENNSNIKKIDNEEYEFILKNVLNSFIDLKSNSEKNNSQIEIENLKEGFAKWLFQQGKYQRVYKNDKAVLIEKLSEYEKAYENDFGIAIFDYPNLSLETIIGELEINVIDESGQIGDLNRRTVGNGSVKAIFGPNNYIKFLKELSKQHKVSSENLTIIGNQKDFDISDFQNSCKNAGLVYSDKLITRFVSSLLTKPFVILTGLSGSGKTKLAQAYVQWICQEESQYRIIPVGADWTNREPLLGYPNALKPEEYVTPDSGVIDLILQANSNPELPHFLILDEMNLSHVERYFADFLSVMESKDDQGIPLYSGSKRFDNNGKYIPENIKVPENLFVIGTVNIDETTNMFSPKVLDRANTIEFRISETEMKDFLVSPKELNMKALFIDETKIGRGANMAKKFIILSDNKSFTTKGRKEIDETLVNFFNELQKTGAEFGYRSATEILRLINQLDALDKMITTSEKIDIAIMQKLLPKLHGSRRKLSSILETLGAFCIDKEKFKNIEKEIFTKEEFEFYTEKNGEIKPTDGVILPISLEKITRMYKGAIDNGFTSFAEA